MYPRVFTVLLAFGTRPEAIKLAPVYNEMRTRADGIRLVCCVTGQHRELLDRVVTIFGMHIDYDLDIIIQNQDLFHITSSVLKRMKDVLLREKPDLVVVQGDTSSAFASALAAFYLRIPIAHVEAGLRSYDRFQPYPEEVNRRFISNIADLHFCPTTRAAQQLLAEKTDPRSIHITGNTSVDALLAAVKLGKKPEQYSTRYFLPPLPRGRMILVTGHRRENFGQGLANLCLALLDLVRKFDDVTVVYSVHPNPNVREPVEKLLSDHHRIRLIPPPDYFVFVGLMNEAFLIITDSGGIQEEAPSLKKPVLVARAVTERPEAVDAGLAVVVGTDRDRIVREASRLLNDPQHYASMVANLNPFGDGRAAERITNAILGFLTDRSGTRVQQS
jgi:UDP-N-acetylglucosamine 2-epimerase (non-hydrolysing)